MSKDSLSSMDPLGVSRDLLGSKSPSPLPSPGVPGEGERGRRAETVAHPLQTASQMLRKGGFDCVKLNINVLYSGFQDGAAGTRSDMATKVATPAVRGM